MIYICTDSFVSSLVNYSGLSYAIHDIFDIRYHKTK